MGDRLRVLILEDQASDAELVADALRQSGLKFDWTRVDSKPDYLAALEEKPDIVLADFRVPGFGALDALEASREQGSDVPVIVISGSLGDELAAECIKCGASDYLLKDRLSRLGPAVTQALERRRLRKEAQQAERALRESEIKYRELIEQASDGIFVTDRKGNYLLVNVRFCEMLGYGEGELLRLNAVDTYPEEERERVALRFADLGDIKTRVFERIMRRKDGTSFPAEVSVKFIGNDRHQGIARDVTERKEAQKALAASEAGLRRAQHMAKLAQVTTRPDGSFESWSDTLPPLVGLKPAEMPRSTREWLDLLHRDDRAMFREKAIEAGVNGARADVEYRLRRADGAWIYVRQVMEPLQGQVGPDGGQHWFNTIQDVTEQKQAEEKIQRLNRVFAVLSGINTLIVRVRDRQELFDGACRIAVEDGNFGMAWIGEFDRTTLDVTPVAWQGMDESAVSMKASARGDIPEGQGMVGRAIRGKKPVITNDISADPGAGGSRREEALRKGFQSIIAMPLMMEGDVAATLTLFAKERNFFSEDELKLLTELAGDISFALDHIEKSNRLDYLAYYDATTGIANRQLLLERVDQRIRIAAEQKSRLALAILDVERFKSINDALGRHAGDQLLKILAGRFVKFHGDADRIGRVLGDQFGILIPNVLSEDDVARRVDRELNECVGVPVRLGDSELRISARVGIALYPENGADASTLFRNAEAALKRAKAAGELYLFYTQNMTERVGENLALENKLRKALENEEFVLHYQPKVDTVTRRIESVEALIRWKSPELGLVPPMQFIPLLEETRLILEVGAWALRRASLDYRRWSEQGLNARIAVNVSSIQLRQRDFVESVRNALGGESSGIDLEITESLIMEDIQAGTEKLEAVRQLGVNIAIDDFGTGYSSLAYLAKLPVQELKIDRSFIITMLKDPAVMTLVSTVISMSHSLGLKVVAEGVDAEDQAKELRRLGCDLMQGYLFSKPVDFDAITALLRKRELATGRSRPPA
jgi:diguanylate cyclase (GGDEF)-like protein/PAS domain S-box-containing protein